MSIFYETLAEIFSAKKQTTPWKWAEQHLTLDNTTTLPGRFQIRNAPFCAEPMEAFADNRIDELTIMCSAQSAKSQMLITCLCWAIAEDPGPALWVMANQDDAEEFHRVRLKPQILSAEPIRRLMIQHRSADKASGMDFSTMHLSIRGAHSPAKLQSLPVRWLILDEVRNYPPQALDTVRKRVRAQWNHRIVQISTPDLENDEMHRSFLQGDQRHFYWACLQCGEHFCPTWDTVKWDTDERTTRANGDFIFDRLAETIRIECPHCHFAHFDNAHTRKRLLQNFRWIPHNETAPAAHRSYHWNAFIPIWIQWRKIVEEFLEAKKVLNLTGSTGKLRIWKGESLGLPWTPDLQEENTLVVEAGAAAYPLRTVGDGIRILTVDVQQDHLWFLVREWQPDGASRLVDWGRVHGFADLPPIQAQYGIPNANVLVDSGFETSAVYAAIARHEDREGNRWKPTKGTPNTDGWTIDGVKRPFFFSYTEIGKGHKPIRLLLFSVALMKDHLCAMIRGGPYQPRWEYSTEAGKDYLSQLTAERRREKVDSYGRSTYFWERIRRNNHVFDLEVLQLLAATGHRGIRLNGELATDGKRN